MVELKTLKDIEPSPERVELEEGEKFPGRWLNEDDLRSAAREHIKKWEDESLKHIGNPEDPGDIINLGVGIDRTILKAKIDCFKHFFNLEDE